MTYPTIAELLAAKVERIGHRRQLCIYGNTVDSETPEHVDVEHCGETRRYWLEHGLTTARFPSANHRRVTALFTVGH